MKPNESINRLLKEIETIMKPYKTPETATKEDMEKLCVDAAVAFSKFYMMRAKIIQRNDEDNNMSLGETEFFFDQIYKKANSYEQEYQFQGVLSKLKGEFEDNKEEKVIN